jgi:hypothetical protein
MTFIPVEPDLKVGDDQQVLMSDTLDVNHLDSSSTIHLEKSVSSTLAERRRLPISPEKLKLYSQIKNQHAFPQQPQQQVLKRLEEENAKLPTQVIF